MTRRQAFYCILPSTRRHSNENASAISISRRHFDFSIIAGSRRLHYRYASAYHLIEATTMLLLRMLPEQPFIAGVEFPAAQSLILLAGRDSRRRRLPRDVR